MFCGSAIVVRVRFRSDDLVDFVAIVGCRRPDLNFFKAGPASSVDERGRALGAGTRLRGCRCDCICDASNARSLVILK